MKFPDKLIALSRKDDGSLTERALKLCEEAGEVAEASLRLIGRKSNKGRSSAQMREHVVEEAVDTLIMCMDIITYLRHDNPKFIEDLIKKKLKKWERSVRRYPSQNRHGS